MLPITYHFRKTYFFFVFECAIRLLIAVPVIQMLLPLICKPIQLIKLMQYITSTTSVFEQPWRCIIISHGEDCNTREDLSTFNLVRSRSRFLSMYVDVDTNKLGTIHNTKSKRYK